MHAEDDTLPLSAVADFVFCPRRAALHRLEQVWQDSAAREKVLSAVAGRTILDKEARSRAGVNIYAHSKNGRPPAEWQPLEQHLRGAAERAGARAAANRAVDGAVAELWLDTHARIRALRARAA